MRTRLLVLSLLIVGSNSIPAVAQVELEWTLDPKGVQSVDRVKRFLGEEPRPVLWTYAGGTEFAIDRDGEPLVSKIKVGEIEVGKQIEAFATEFPAAAAGAAAPGVAGGKYNKVNSIWSLPFVLVVRGNIDGTIEQVIVEGPAEPEDQSEGPTRFELITAEGEYRPPKFGKEEPPPRFPWLDTNKKPVPLFRPLDKDKNVVQGIGVYVDSPGMGDMDTRDGVGKPFTKLTAGHDYRYTLNFRTYVSDFFQTSTEPERSLWSVTTWQFRLNLRIVDSKDINSRGSIGDPKVSQAEIHVADAALTGARAHDPLKFRVNESGVRLGKWTPFAP